MAPSDRRLYPWAAQASLSPLTVTGLSRPLGSLEIPQFYLPGEAPTEAAYAPRIYGAARIQFADRKRGLDEMRRVAFLALKTIDPEAAEQTENR